jgi:hypothetical protein
MQNLGLYSTAAKHFLKCDCQQIILEGYSCNENGCDFQTNFLVHLRTHIRESHRIKYEVKGLESNYELRPYDCENCSFETYSVLKWLRHENVESIMPNGLSAVSVVLRLSYEVISKSIKN